MPASAHLGAGMKARQREARQFEDACFVQWRLLNTGRQRKSRAVRREVAVLYFLQVAGVAAGISAHDDNDDVDADVCNQGPGQKRGRGRGGVHGQQRTVFPKPGYARSVWWDYLNNPDEAGDPKSRLGKQFRKRFRIPFKLFCVILDRAVQEKWFPELVDGAGLEKRVNRFGVPMAPMAFKILGALRLMGRGCNFDDIEELNGISAETNRVFFHRFTAAVVEFLMPEYIRAPTDIEEISSIVAEYARRGFPGAIGSIDCTHIPWARVPAEQATRYIGKEGFPTISYEVVCTHSTRVLGITRGHAGALNDIQISGRDPFVAKLRRGVYAAMGWTLRTVHGWVMRTGLYLISDNGYQTWSCYMMPFTLASSPKEERWKARIESVRKDVECFFGRLKHRFRCLRVPCEFAAHVGPGGASLKVDNMMLTCATLHNILLEEDFRVHELAHDCVKFLANDGVTEYADFSSDMDFSDLGAVVAGRINPRTGKQARVLVTNNTDLTATGSRWLRLRADLPGAILDLQDSVLFSNRRSELVEHFDLQKAAGLVEW